MLTNSQFGQFRRELAAIIAVYKKEFSQRNPTDWITHEKQWAARLRTALKELKPVIAQAASVIRVNLKPLGRPPDTSVKQKVLILLAKGLAQSRLSNKRMANLLPLFALFALFDDVDVCYKTIERAYSNPLARMMMHNMFITLVKRKGIEQADLAGDGTGYSLTITRHYRTARENVA